MVFSIFTESCYYTIPSVSFRTLSSPPPRNKSHTHQTSVSIPPHPSPAPSNHSSAFCLSDLLTWTFHTHGIIHAVLCIWLLSLSVNLQGSLVLYLVSVLHSFFFLQPNSIIPWFECVTFCLSSHLLMDIWIVSSSALKEQLKILKTQALKQCVPLVVLYGR